MSVEVDLFNDFAEKVRVDFELDGSIDQLEVVRIYAWYDLRRLPQKQWRVHYSKELQQNPFYITHKDHIDSLREKAKAGNNLTSHASTLIDDNNGKDDMLADWGIYHLHPGHGTKPAKISGFVNRAGELLFVFPSGDNLYFLDILNHKAWTNFSLIKIIDNNWPSAIDQYRLKDAISLSHEPTEEELYKLRKNQLNSAFRVGSSFFMGPGGGLATSGASNQAVRMSLDVKKLLSDYSNQLREEENELREILNNKTGYKQTVDPLKLQLTKYDPKKGAGEMVEENTHIQFSFNFPR